VQFSAPRSPANARCARPKPSRRRFPLARDRARIANQQAISEARIANQRSVDTVRIASEREVRQTEIERARAIEEAEIEVRADARRGSHRR
jgi:hypothetical protein